MEQIIKEATQKMNKSVEAFRSELAKVRTGKATTALLDGIRVDYYGTPTPLNQTANVSVLDAHTLSISPWDRNMIGTIEKAILQADLGLNPMNDGTNLKIPIPPLTEERRKEFVKLVRKFGEDAKIAIRNIRRDANEHLKKKQKEDKISEDITKDSEATVQKITNDHISEIDRILAHKEKEIMEV
ncbi:MAG: ribosome recycling factor [Ignavibacteriales bacterium]|nr:Ribosome-recycling factor [Ignavibacteriaceae bacterium]MBZ0196598.1 ribosome recycling factor [Ignavibacteriaceae bacterium]MCZ2143214.1 ribosome recycling factor [Ignavibacteriales bacterium]WKZ72457.1 MAG: ribosome recycling factor [Ignavibacteriaceae bacterium]